MAKKQPIDIAAAIQKMQQEDPMLLKMIGRQAGLPTLRELIASETVATKKLLLEEAYAIELKIIKAAKDKDEEKFTDLDTQSKAIFDQLKLLDAITR